MSQLVGPKWDWCLNTEGWVEADPIDFYHGVDFPARSPSAPRTTTAWDHGGFTMAKLRELEVRVLVRARWGVIGGGCHRQSPDENWLFHVVSIGRG